MLRLVRDAQKGLQRDLIKLKLIYGGAMQRMIIDSSILLTGTQKTS